LIGAVDARRKAQPKACFRIAMVTTLMASICACFVFFAAF
jgi:hypothetical protein